MSTYIVERTDYIETEPVVCVEKDLRPGNWYEIAGKCEAGVTVGNLRTRAVSIILDAMRDEVKVAETSGSVDKHMASRLDYYCELMADLIEDACAFTDRAREALDTRS